MSSSRIDGCEFAGERWNETRGMGAFPFGTKESTIDVNASDKPVRGASSNMPYSTIWRASKAAAALTERHLYRVCSADVARGSVLFAHACGATFVDMEYRRDVKSSLGQAVTARHVCALVSK